MGHSVKLDDVYYDKNSGKSQTKLLEEYSKAIEYLTINEENRLRKKVEVLKAKRDEIEMLKGQAQQKDDKLTVMEERFNSMQSQLQNLILALGNTEDQNVINQMAQNLYDSKLLKNDSGKGMKIMKSPKG
jgi:seryl-tRNA synthetase